MTGALSLLHGVLIVTERSSSSDKITVNSSNSVTCARSIVCVKKYSRSTATGCVVCGIFAPRSVRKWPWSCNFRVYPTCFVDSVTARTTCMRSYSCRTSMKLIKSIPKRSSALFAVVLFRTLSFTDVSVSSVLAAPYVPSTAQNRYLHLESRRVTGHCSRFWRLW